MDFLLMLAIYCTLFVVGCLCILYRDATVLNTGLVGWCRQLVIEAVIGLLPRRIIDVGYDTCHYLLFKRNCVFQLLFVVLCLLAHAVWVVDMLPILYRHHPDDNHTFWPLLAVFLNYWCLHKAWLGDPGEITGRSYERFKAVYSYDGVLYKPGVPCRTCKFVKLARSKHCSTCNRCVARFDHHCIWTNNCVGALTHRYFILFMVTLVAMFLQGIYVGTGCLCMYAEDIRLYQASFVDDEGNVRPMTFAVAFQHLFMEIPRLVFLIVACVVLTVLVGIFLSQHIYMTAINQTTNERYKASDIDTANRTNQSAGKSESNSKCTCDENGEMRRTKGDKASDNLKTRFTETRNTKSRDILPYNRGIVNNLFEVFLPQQFINNRNKTR